MQDRRFKRSSRVVKRDVAGEHLLIPVVGTVADVDKVFVLEGTGDFIWSLLDGHMTCGEIAQRVVETFETTAGQARKDAEAFIARLVRAKLVEEIR